MIIPHQIGPYRVLRPLGGGGFSEVLLGQDTRQRTLGKYVALKRVRPDLRGKGLFYEKSIVSEGRIAKALSTPHMVKVNGVMAHEGEPVMVMEYVEGFGLDELLSRVAGRGIPWPWVGVIGLQIVEALRALHRDGEKGGYVHQDLKPSNIRVTPRGLVKVLDLGIAAPLLEPLARIRQGTPGYRSPEQVLGARSLGAASDVYTLGIVLFELTTGKRLFPEHICRDVDKIGHAQRKVVYRLQLAVDEGILPGELAAILSKMLCYSIRERTRTALDVELMIRPWVKEQRVKKQAFRAWSHAIFEGLEQEKGGHSGEDISDPTLDLASTETLDGIPEIDLEAAPSEGTFSLPGTRPFEEADIEVLDDIIVPTGLGRIKEMWRRPGQQRETLRFAVFFGLLVAGFWLGFKLMNSV